MDALPRRNPASGLRQYTADADSFLSTLEGNFVGPFVYGLDFELNLDTFERIYTEDTESLYIAFDFLFAAKPYRFLGSI